MHFDTEQFPRIAESTPPQVFEETNRERHCGRKRRARRFVSCLCAGGVLGGVLALCPAGGLAQSEATYQGSPQTPPSLAPGTKPWGRRDTALRKMTERMAKQRNTDRQKKIVADTAKLLAMAQKLNDEVSHSSKNELSISVVEQATEIEKLAKSIKEKMKNGY